jgi:hypothetical protein
MSTFCVDLRVFGVYDTIIRLRTRWQACLGEAGTPHSDANGSRHQRRLPDSAGRTPVSFLADLYQGLPMAPCRFVNSSICASAASFAIP